MMTGVNWVGFADHVAIAYRAFTKSEVLIGNGTTSPSNRLRVVGSLSHLAEDLPLELMDVIVPVFRELKGSRSPLRPQELLRDLDLDKKHQALQELVSRRLAILVQPGHYRISPEGQQTSEHDLLHRLLKPRCERTRKMREHRSRIARWSNVFAVLSLLVMMIAGGTLIAYMSVQNLFFLLPALVLAILLAAAILLDNMARKKVVSREDEVGVDLLAAYEIYRPFIADRWDVLPRKAEKLVKKAAESLKEARYGELEGLQFGPPPPWATVKSLCDRISRIGQDLGTRIIPAMKDHKRAESVGGVMVWLARFLFEGSASSIQRASELFSDYDSSGQPCMTWLDRVSSAIRTRLLVCVVFCVLVVCGAGILTLYATNWNWLIAGVVGTWAGLVAGLVTLLRRSPP